ncbi:hypothetical protein KEM55_009237, partial [Ascosphaera atra]
HVTGTGNGPSSLILSYILHGHVPFYNLEHPHPDPILHKKLKPLGESGTPILAPDFVDFESLTEHLPGSRFNYSPQALPVNALFDALRRPAGDDVAANERSACIKWEYRPELAISHLVIGDAAQPGGQWADCPKGTSTEVQSLSYSGLLSLPGYTFSEHVAKHGRGKIGNTADPGDHPSSCEIMEFERPLRREVADYYAAYPAAVGIADTIRCGEQVQGVCRKGSGFYISSHDLTCRRLVLATGTLTESIPPPEHLQPLNELPLPSTQQSTDAPLLLIGSGFSAADTIISASPSQKIIHIFRWDPEGNPSPLQGSHPDSYPMSSAIYRLMRAAAQGAKVRVRQGVKRTPMLEFLQSRNWDEVYEGLPNATVIAVDMEDGIDQVAGNGVKTATVTIALENGETIVRRAGCLVYAIGRRGRLDCLDDELYHEVTGREYLSSRCSRCSSPAYSDSSAVSLSRTQEADGKYATGLTFREKALYDMEVAPGVFIIGSLTGDSLVRFADGSCIYAAGKIMHDLKQRELSEIGQRRDVTNDKVLEKGKPLRGRVMTGMDGHNDLARRLSNVEITH